MRNATAFMRSGSESTRCSGSAATTSRPAAPSSAPTASGSPQRDGGADVSGPPPTGGRNGASAPPIAGRKLPGAQPASTTRPPLRAGATARASSRAAAAWSGAYIAPKTESTASNAPSATPGSAWASPTRQSIGAPDSAARSAATSSNAGSRSTPTTSAAPRSAASSAALPVPQATSSTRSPGATRARATTRRAAARSRCAMSGYSPAPQVVAGPAIPWLGRHGRRAPRRAEAGVVGVPGPPKPQRAENGARRGRAVHGAEVDAGRAVGQQVGALHRRVGDAELGDGLLVFLARVELAEHVFGHRRAAQPGDRLDLAVVGDGHDPRDDRDLDPDRPRPVDEVVEQLVVEEQLGDEEVDAGVDLRLEVAQVVLGGGGVDVRLGEARRGDREVVVGAQQRDELVGVLQPALGGHPLGLPARRVAAQREDVVDAGLADLGQRAVQLVGRRADAGEMRHRLQPVGLLD